MAAKKSKPNPTTPVEDAKIGNAPSVRVFSDWTNTRIRTAERSAESGDMTLAVTLCEWLLTDDAVTAALFARVNALLGLEPTFEEGAGRNAKKAAKALEAEEDWFESYPEAELRNLLIWGILLGGAPSRLAPWTERPDHGGRVLSKLSFWHPQTLKWDAYMRRLSVRNLQGLEIEVKPGDGEWMFHAPFGFERFWSSGLWRSLSRWVLLKQLAAGDWSRHSEKGSLLVALAPAGATQKQRQELAADLQASGADTVVALAAGFDMKLLEVSANTQSIYDAQIKAADDAIRIRIRGSNLTTKVDANGSKAAAETQAKGGDTANLKADANALSTTVHDQGLVWWAEFNFGDKRAAPWPAWPVEPDENKSERATMVKTLGEGLTIWDKLGFEIDPKAVQEEFGLSFLNGRPRPREPEPVPGADPAKDGGKAGSGDQAPKPAKKPKANAEMAATKKPAGYVEGQLYVDDVTDDVEAEVAPALKSSLLNELMAVIAKADDYEGIRSAVLEAYGAAKQPEEVRELVRKALVLSDLAGAKSVLQDA